MITYLFILTADENIVRPPFNYAIMIRYQGENIDFSVTLNDTSSISSWKDLDNVFLYLYTDTSHIAKFSGEIRDGYGCLTISDDGKVLYGLLLPTSTLTMQGALKMDILGTNGTKKAYIRNLYTGIEIAFAPIKQELQ